MLEKFPSSPTLRDVAKLAGVSYQTVSRVVNNSPHVSAETLEKVNRAIAELNYQPNRTARNLATGKSHSIHVLVLDVFNLRMLPAIEYGARTRGYQLHLFNSLQGRGDDMKSLVACLGESIASQPDGLIFLLPWNLVSVEQLRSLTAGVPFVVVGSSLGAGTNSILVDQYEGTRLIVQHLLDLGHRSMAAIHGIAHYYDAQIRQETLESMLREHDLELVASDRGLFDMKSGYEAALRLLSQKVHFTALVCANDEMALGAIRAIKDQGLRVPQDISVVGFDDQNFAAYCDPRLTTVQQDFDALGAQSFNHLLSLMESSETPPHQRILYPKLIVRDSTAAPRESAAHGR